MTPAQLEALAQKLSVTFNRPLEHCRRQVRYMLAAFMEVLGNKPAADRYLAAVGIGGREKRQVIR